MPNAARPATMQECLEARTWVGFSVLHTQARPHGFEPQPSAHQGKDLGKSPFYQRIKRLGVATEGRFGETITQATFVQSLMKYISKNEMKDRDTYKRGNTPKKADADESEVCRLDYLD